MPNTPDTAEINRQNQFIQSVLGDQRRKQGRAVPEPLPSNPDEAAAIALSAILDPTSNVLPGDVFRELARRNEQLVNAPEAEIKATLARQIALLEATATRFFQKAATTSSASASAEFNRAALATNRVLIQALGAINQMSQVQVLTVEGEDSANVG